MSKRKRSTDTAAKLDAAARTAYNSFVRECGYEKDARIPEYEKLTPEQHERWRTVARDVIEAFR